MSRNIAPFGLRMPPELKHQIEIHAEQNKRSLNAEVVHRLQESFISSSRGQAGISLSEELLNRLKKIASKKGTTLTAIVEERLVSALPHIDQGEDTVRIYSNGSTYRDLEMICEDIRHDSPISALFAVRDGKYNKSALTLVLYTEEKACVYDQTLLTAERGAREAEIWEICNALDSFNVFKNTKFITERVEQTQEMEPDNALALLESKPSKPINKDTLCQFLSMFGNTEGEIYPRDMFLDYWDRLF